MRKSVSLLLLLLLLLLCAAAFGITRDVAGDQPEGTFMLTPTPTIVPTPAPTPVPTPEPPNYLHQVYADPDADYLDMGDVVIKDFDEFYRFLDQLPNLRNVDMFATKIKKGRIEELALRYPNIHFGMSMVIAEHTIRTDQTAFSTLHYRTSAPHTSEDFSILKYCDHLLALDVGHNKVDDLSFLYDLPELKVLIIAINNIEDITPVSSLHDLEYLELFKNKIEDISAVSGLTKLLDLNICFNHVKDYTPLYGLKQLMRLWVYQSHTYSVHYPISEEIVASLKEELPDTFVDSTHYSTAGTWRKHPHYDVIVEMFKHGTYIPFEESWDQQLTP